MFGSTGAGSQGPTTPFFAPSTSSSQPYSSSTQYNPGITQNSLLTGYSQFVSDQPGHIKPNVNDESQLNSQKILPEVQMILDRLNNADLRSCQVLTDTFKRLKSLATEPPPFVAFTFGLAPDPQVAQQRRQWLEQEVLNLDNPQITEAFRQVKVKNPDVNKYYIIPIKGFEGMIEHTQLQKAHMSQIENHLKGIEHRQEVIQNHLRVRSFKRYQDILKRQRQLMLNVMHTVGLIEEFALKHSLAQLDIPFLKKLQTDLTIAIDEFQSSNAGNIALSQLTSKLTKVLKSATGSAPPQDTPDQNLRTFVEMFVSKRRELHRHQTQSVSSYDFKVIEKLIKQFDTLFEPLELSVYTHSLRAKKLTELSSTASEQNA